jgi:hypothetical protein
MLLAHWVNLEKKIYPPNLTPMCSPFPLDKANQKKKKKNLLNNRMQKTHEE